MLLWYEDLVAPYNNNINNNLGDDDEIEIEELLSCRSRGASTQTLLPVPGILDLIDEIPSLHPNESAGYTKPNKVKNIFLADPLGCASSAGGGRKRTITTF